MKYPQIGSRTQQSVRIPELSGGINKRDAINQILDNQLTDSVNMWFDGGLLTTRPSFNLIDARIECRKALYLVGGHILNEELKVCDGDINGYKFIGVKAIPTDDNKGRLSFFCINPLNKKQLKFVNESGVDTEITNGHFDVNSFFLIRHKDSVYCFVSGADYGKTIKEGRVYKFSGFVINEENNEATMSITLLDHTNGLYVPTIATHCLPNGKGYGLASSVNYEGYNRLCGYYKVIYSTVNRGLFVGGTTTHKAIYRLFTNVHGYNGAHYGKTVTVEYTNADGDTYTHSVTISEIDNNNLWNVEATKGEDNYYIKVRKNMLVISSNNSKSEAATIDVSDADYVEDNMTITAPCNVRYDNYGIKVYACTQNAWFGGTVNGTRLFVGGNTNDNDKAMIFYSDIDNPLYFPSSNYQQVGDSSAVTAFGKQNDRLIIFKKSEIHSSYYQRIGITGESLINQENLNVTTDDVIFPTIQLHGSIGCDCPNTIQLCDNRLIWANSSGKVYTLVNSSDQYTEKSVSEISGLVERQLKEEDVNMLKAAVSLDWNGYYLLMIKKKENEQNSIYVFDYQSYGFRYVNSYSKTEDAALRLPVYYWQTPAVLSGGFEMNGRAVILSLCYSRTKTIPDTLAENLLTLEACYFEDNLEDDIYLKKEYSMIKRIPFKSMLQTKTFDFSVPQFRKAVSIINIEFGNNGGIPIVVKYIVDGTAIPDEEIIEIFESSTDKYNVNNLHNRQLRPNVRNFVKIGLKIETQGRLSVGAMSLIYKLLGGAR